MATTEQRRTSATVVVIVNRVALALLAISVVRVVFPYVRPAAWQPTIACDRPVADFGMRRATEKAVVHYELQNRSWQPLSVKRVVATCPCIKPMVNRTPTIAPFSTSTISLELKLKGLRDEVRKLVAVETNDPERPLLNLLVKGTVATDIVVSPKAFHLPATREKSNGRSSEVVLRAPATSGRFALISATPTASWIHVEVTRNSSSEYRLCATFTDDVPPENTTAAVVVRTDYPGEEQIVILAFAESSSADAH